MFAVSVNLKTVTARSGTSWAFFKPLVSIKAPHVFMSLENKRDILFPPPHKRDNELPPHLFISLEDKRE